MSPDDRALSEDYLTFRARLIATAERDDRIVGLIDYGSTAEGRGDRWSDVDAALWLHDDAYEPFRAEWRAWAAGLGDLLLAYVGAIGHPWAVYRGDPLPLRADFNFYPESHLEEVDGWPISPRSVASAVWYDATGGRLSARVGALVGSDLNPESLEGAFERCCGDLWYYALRVQTKLLRDELWAARWEYGTVVLDNLMWLLRIEAGAVDRWRASIAATGIERAITPERLRRLDRCVPGPEREGIEGALREALELGHELCAGLAAQHGWSWPIELAETVVMLDR